MLMYSIFYKLSFDVLFIKIGQLIAEIATKMKSQQVS